MSLADWDDAAVQDIREGLLLLGWRIDYRWTSDDALFLQDLSREALSLHASHALTPDETERLALAAYVHIAPQVMSAEERAFMATGPYSDSRNLHPSLRMLDEAVLCFEAECFTAALALLFIVLERYLRSVANWAPGRPELTFRQLRE